MIQYPKQKLKKNVYWKINEQIRAPQLRVLGEDGKQIDVMDRDTALKRAREAGVDLVEIAGNANPAVAKIINFGKFLYQEEKKKKQGAKKAKGGEVKEVRFSPFIAENDYNTRLERVKEFLKDKNKVKLTVVFKGRQLGSKSFGYELLGKVNKTLEGTIHIDMEPKFIGRHLVMVISPKGQNAESKNA